MEVIADLSSPPWGDGRSVVTIGMYDGVHLGHRTVINQVRERAAGLGARSVVVT
ncbi:MAG: adenylyltransferase/riboflavin kinase, partial [Actinomycetota bacterium]